MLGYRRKSYEHAFSLLREVGKFPDKLTALLECERLLLREIVHAEGHIRRLKAEQQHVHSILRTARPPKDKATRLKADSERLKSRIERYRQLIYIWRCFGDGLAFTYLDKHAIKHAYYSTQTVQPKQDAGFLSGKDGLANEIALVEDAVASGVPSILTDLTNSIRHGDVCLLGESDPVLIEVKAGGRLGERGRRQVAAIEKLHSFYETDVAKDMRGFSEIRRVEHPIAEVTYVSDFNRCIRGAEADGACVVNPETGLYYIALYDSRHAFAELFSTMTLSRPLIYTLNSAKSNRSWSPYAPFTLTIEERNHLYDFIRGELYLVVVVDIDVLCKGIERPGVESSWVEGDDYPLKFTNTGVEGQGGISQHLLNRIGFEFVSPQWIIACALDHPLGETGGSKVERA